jgi:glycosyltransferase involved in cell wall biosynthesis
MRTIAETEREARLAMNRAVAVHGSHHCTAVLCNTVFTANALAAAGIERLHVLRGGVDVDAFRPLDKARLRAAFGWPEGAFVAFVAARHVAKKGLDVAIEAMALLPEEHHLIIAGDGPESDRLAVLAARRRLLHRIRFIGVLPHVLVPRYLAAADIALAPSRSIFDPRRFAIDEETMCRFLC